MNTTVSLTQIPTTSTNNFADTDVTGFNIADTGASASAKPVTPASDNANQQ